MGTMTKEEMNKFLESIGGLENGFFTGSVGLGWYPIIKDLIEDLIKLGWDKQLCQAKEKFGGLRFYINSGSDEIHKRIQLAENQSYETCEICGEEGELRTNIGWYTTLCNKHYEEHKSNIQK
jgi:hypothetical protein